MKNHMSKISRVLILVFAVSGVLAVTIHAAAVRPRLASGSGNGDSERPQISADGRYIVFASNATNLVPGISDTNGQRDIFLRDLQTGTIRCLSVAIGGTSTGNDGSDMPRISADGRYVVFWGNASNLVPNDNNSQADVFRYDTQANTNTLVSINIAGTGSGNANSADPDLSSNGRFVVFASRATDLVAGIVDGNGGSDHFVRDMQTGTTQLVTVNSAGTATGNGGEFTTGHRYGFDASGRYVVFRSFSSDLAAGISDTNNVQDVFVRDLQTNTTTCVSVTPAGNSTGNSTSLGQSLSADGRRVFFESEAANLVANDNNNTTDAFMRDLTTGTSQLVSINAAGTGSGNGASGTLAFIDNAFGMPISSDGRYVVFNSNATDLVTGVNISLVQNVFVRDIDNGTTTIVSANSAGTASGNDASRVRAGSSISSNGRFITFTSAASNLVSEDTNTNQDIFVRDNVTRTTTLLTLNQAGTNGGNRASDFPVIAVNTRRVAFHSFASDFVPGPGGAFSNIYYSDFGPLQKAIADFDGDGRSDFSVFRPSTGTWYVLPVSSGFINIRQWGQIGDRIVPADYDGDGKADHAIFRPSENTWYIQRSSDAGGIITQFGVVSDIPAPADFDGDGKVDLAVFRPSTGTWIVQQSSNGQPRFVQFGLNGDLPVASDYDGDGTADFAVFRPSDNTWYVLKSTDGSFIAQPFGLSSDKLVPGDYDGDSRTDIAIFRPSSGIWYILQSSTGQVQLQQWGVSTDIPVAGSYDGDGKTDMSVFRPSTGQWFVLRSSSNTMLGLQWGANGDVPAPAAYVP